MLTIPFPPSVNRLWRQFKGRTILSAVGRKYRKEVMDLIWVTGWSRIFPGEIHVEIKAYMPDARKRDLDNLLKASLDALTHSGLWIDDSQIKKLTIEHCGIDRHNPRLEVSVEAL